MNPTSENKESAPQVGEMVRMAKEELKAIVQEFRKRNYRTILPKVADGAVVYADADDISRLPLGMLDQQEGGSYRLRKNNRDGYFDYVVGPHSVKPFLFPPAETVLQAERKDGQWQFETPEAESQSIAIFGVRSCDLHAIAIQDRVFLEGPYVDQAYRARRERLALVAVNCRRAAVTCFCHSMKTGPAVRDKFDLALTELEEEFAVEIGSPLGSEIISACRWSACSAQERQEIRQIPARLEQKMMQGRRGFVDGDDEEGVGRELDTSGVRDLLVNNLEHPHWEDVAQRCLSCANCTLVCPTCFQQF